MNLSTLVLSHTLDNRYLKKKGRGVISLAHSLQGGLYFTLWRKQRS